MNFNKFTKMTLVLLILNAGSLLSMALTEPNEIPEGAIIIEGGVGIEEPTVYTTASLRPWKNEPKSLQKQAITTLAKQIIEGRMTIEQAKEKLPQELHEELEKEVRLKSFFANLK